MKKKINKNTILGFVLGILLCGTVGVVATNYAASQITYNKNGKATVADALDDLYSKNSEKLIFVSLAARYGAGSQEVIFWMNNYIDNEYIEYNSSTSITIRKKGKIKINCSIEDYDVNSTTPGYTIFKNNVAILSDSVSNSDTKVSNTIIEVEEGDIITGSLTANGGGNATFLNTVILFIK